MWKVDPRGSFRFADTTDAGTRFLLSFGEDTKFKDQSEIIYSHFKDQTATQSQVKSFCIEQTAFPTFWSSSLKILEDNEQLVVTTPRKRKGTFPEGCIIRFKNG